MNDPRELISIIGEFEEVGNPRILGCSGGIGMVGLLFNIIDCTGAGPLGVWLNNHNRSPTTIGRASPPMPICA